ncbi:CHASE2 domain-containing protein [Tsuneonella sp. YG55]|uniref:CHASE2 domain-containing protein n=2 Tax=Tsuneonella litorea TaxID=2976475 RepID=A0A9X3AKJ3_9SPHN|nr:CHASE2 domain-containing protein [Tsuneonella litorea]
MASASKSDIRSRHTVGTAVLLGGLLGAILGLLAGDLPRRTLTDIWQRSAPRAIGTENVAVVLIDSSSIGEIGSWPWSRYYVARLTGEIARQRPVAIGIDIIFAEPDALSPRVFSSLYPELERATVEELNRLPTADDELASVFGAAPVLLARLGVQGEGTDPAQLMVDPAVQGQPPTGTLRSPQALTSIPQLDDVALAHGFINGPPDEDGVVRRIPLSIMVDDRPMPGMAVELARLAAGAPHLAWQGGAMQLGAMRLPVDDSGSLPLRFGAFPPDAVHSAVDVITGQVPPDAFAGKVVLVGLGAEGAVDIVATPLASETFGVYVQAQAVDAILEGDWLSRPSWTLWLEAAAGLFLLLLVLIAGETRRYRLLGAALLVALAIPLVSWLSFVEANVVFDPIRPVLIGLCGAVALWVTLHALARSERARLAAALVEERVASAEKEGELNAARRIQQGMVPGPEKLADLDPRVGVGAILESARSVGGDFYEAVMIDADRLLFLVGDVTGKGVPAALFMALSKALSASFLSRGGDDLGAAAAALNRDLMTQADEEMGLTMILGTLDCNSGTLALVNAGHENPLVVRADGEVEVLEMVGGPPFCVMDFPYAEESFALLEKDTLVLITDGATEAENDRQTMYGIDGVIAALRDEGDMPAAERATDLAARVRAFEGDTEPSDDLTIFTLRYRGRTS